MSHLRLSRERTQVSVSGLAAKGEKSVQRMCKGKETEGIGDGTGEERRAHSTPGTKAETRGFLKCL